MAQPVWVLSVDLQTKTATFQSGMADAAKSARGAFTEIKTGASEMGGHVSTNMFASRHAIMAVSEAFGDTMPRAITALLVHIGPLGAALEAAFPFAAIALGAVLIIEHLAKLREEGEKLTEDQMKFGTAVQNAFNQLDQKLIQAQIKSDELRNDHLGALRLQLELIDKQSLEELVHSFGEVAKAADVVFTELKTSWYQFGIGSAGAKHALEDFQTKYDQLLAQGKDKEASNLLAGTLSSAEKVLSAQKKIKALNDDSDTVKVNDPTGDQSAYNTLKAAAVGYTDKEVQAQQTLVDALNAQITLEGKVNELKKVDKGNATGTTGKELAALQAEGQRQAAEHSRKMGELTLQIEREKADAELTMRAATIAERLASDMHLADEEYRIQSTANQALIAALDKGGKDYNNQLKGLQEKAEELTLQHEATIAGLKGKAQAAQYREDIQNLEASEREKIESTMQGSAARLAAIDAAMREEQAKGLQDTQFYRDLEKQKVEVQRQAAEESAKIAAEAGKEEAENEQKMGELMLTARKQAQQLADSAHRVTIQQRLAEETQAANEEYALKMAAMQREAAALDKGAKDYENKLKAIQNKEKQLVQQHENEITRIKQQAEEERNSRILSAEQHFNDTIAAGLTQVLMGHKSFASMMDTIGNQVVSGMMENAIKSVLANDFTKESDAAAAARKAFNAGMQFPFPVNVVMAPVLGAAAFASVMAFEEGGIVPGVGRGDTVPAMLSPGEGVVPGGVMDGLRNMVRSGGMSGGQTVHVQAHYAPQIHAVDATGVDRMLAKHQDTFQRHFENTIRRMNK
jgi:hypothetical protein